MTQITASLVKELREKTGAGMMDCKKALVECNGDFEASVDWLRKKGMGAAAKKSGRTASEGLVSAKQDGAKAVLVELNSETDFVSRNEQFQELLFKLTETSFNNFDKIENAANVADLDLEGIKVSEAINNAIATIGENINLRRVAKCSVSEGVVSTYVHNEEKPNMGKIAIAVAVKSSGESVKLSEIGKKVAMHIAASRPECLTIENVDPANVEREKQIFSDQARASGKPENIIEKMVEGRIRKYYDEVVLLEQAFLMDPKIKVKDFIENSAKELGVDVKIDSFIRFELGEGVEKREDDFASEVAGMVK